MGKRTRSRARSPEGFYNCVRRLREERGLSQADLCRLTGMSQPFLSLLEHGKTGGSMDTWKRIATAFGVGIDDLL